MNLMNLRFLLPVFALSLATVVGCSASGEDASTSASNLDDGTGLPDIIPENLGVLARVRWEAGKAESGLHGDSVVVFQVDDFAPAYLEASKEQLGVILPDGANTSLSFASSIAESPFSFSIPENASFAAPGTTACADLAATATVTVDAVELAADVETCSFTVVKNEAETLPAGATDLPYKLHIGVFETDVVSADASVRRHLRSAFILAERPASPAPPTEETTVDEVTTNVGR